MAAAVGYRIIARDVEDGPVTGTAYFWATLEGYTGDPFLAGGVAVERGTTAHNFWISPNLRKLCAWRMMGNPFLNSDLDKAKWTVVIVDYDTADIIETVDDGVLDTLNPSFPLVTLVQHKVSTGVIRDEEFSRTELTRLGLWCDSTGGDSATTIMAAHSITEKGPSY